MGFKHWCPHRFHAISNSMSCNEALQDLSLSVLLRTDMYWRIFYAPCIHFAVSSEQLPLIRGKGIRESIYTRSLGILMRGENRIRKGYAHYQYWKQTCLWTHMLFLNVENTFWPFWTNSFVLLINQDSLLKVKMQLLACV